MGEHAAIRQLLYEAIRELIYVQEAKPACGSDLCATSKGAEIIERGKKLLGTNDFDEAQSRWNRERSTT